LITDERYIDGRDLLQSVQYSILYSAPERYNL